jgi:PEP-CTERM motif
MMKWKAVVRVATLVAALGGGIARADVLISNLSPDNGQQNTFLNAPSGGANGGGPNDSKATGFTIPVGSPYTLNSVDLKLEFFTTSTVPNVSIYNNTVVGGVNEPGTLLQTLTNPAITVSNTPTDYLFTSPAALTLGSGQTYWIVATDQTTVADSYIWTGNSPSTVPTGIATSAGYRFDFVPPFPPRTVDPTVFNAYAVNATLSSVPEPSVLALGGLTGMLAIAGRFVARRRRDQPRSPRG